ncbi:MAG: PepSY domain-containing protein [Paracoccaceae bacterium]|nr:PepSY domain-containing protein [Paracoccaceae bacterium]
MKSLLMILAFLVALPPAAAWAGDDDCYAPLADWQPRDRVVQWAQEQGWTLRRIRIDDGCYELDGTDAQGRRIEAILDPATLAVIEMEFDDDDDDDDDDHDWSRNRGGKDRYDD